jgi:hypothetical protein
MPSNNTKETVFLQGALIAGFASVPLARPSSAGPRPAGLGFAVAGSETTLTCWEKCTVYISGC